MASDNGSNPVSGKYGLLIRKHLYQRPSLILASIAFLVKTRDPKAVVDRIREYIRVKASTPEPELTVSDVFFDWSKIDIEQINRRVEQLSVRPLMSIITPLYNTPEVFLKACVGSVRDQPYQNWELILIDDASPNPRTHELARKFAQTDKRIRLIEREKNGNISRASNDGLAAASGEFIMMLDHDDELSPDALLRFAEEVNDHPDVDAIYSDQLKCDEHGRVIDHHFKPDWSPVFLEGVMYVGHLLCVRTSLARSLGGFDSQYDGVQDFEFMLRLSEISSKIRHIPEPLYKWRAISGSLAAGVNEKSDISEKQALAVNQHFIRLGRPQIAESNQNIPHRVILRSSKTELKPKISIIIPSKDQGPVISRCLESIFELTTYENFEVILVDNGTTDPIALAAFERYPIERIQFNEKFNYSRANNIGFERASGEYVMLLNNDTEVLEPRWLNDLIAYFGNPKVGMVGPVLLYPDGRVQHAGVVLGARGTADHAMRFFPSEVDGYSGSLSCSREVSAVTAACLLMPSRLYEKLGGLREDFATHYQDVDLCLKVRHAGYNIICASYPRLLHYESISRKEGGYDLIDRAILLDFWYETLRSNDPFYSEKFDLKALDYSLKL
jgi:GT2 family glycosyltransferase